MKRIFLFFLISTLSNSVLSETYGIKHIVLCWLKEPDNLASLNLVMEISRQLKNIAQVDDLVVGKAVASDRNIVDDSFDVGLVMNFRDHQDLEQYLVHEDHVRRVKEVLVPMCQRILVYDIAY